MQVEVRLLGGFAVTIDGQTVERSAWTSRRAAQLVALLALAPGRRLATEQVMDALWPDLAPDAARANLHKAATLARRALGSKEAVVLRREAVTLWPSGDVRVDVADFEKDAREALRSGESDGCAAVAARAGGELLPDERYEPWTETVRGRVERLYHDLLRAAGMWSELVEIDPTDESAHYGVMRQHLDAGRLHAAIRQFQRLRAVLARELGVLPGPQTLALYREILGTSGPASDRPALVGREVELVRARATLRRAASGRPAALFVTGPSGIGKTRLCDELVDQARGEGWFVLAGVGREQTAAVPYWPLVEAIQSALLERPELGEALDGTARALLSRLTGLPGGRADDRLHRHAVLHVVSRVRQATGASRAMVFLDDLDHVDDDTVALAEALASAPTPRGAFLLAAYRPRADGRAAEAALRMVRRGVGTEIELGPLSRAETDLMVARITDARRPVVGRDLVWDLSEGNPFLAREVAAALSAEETGTAPGTRGAVKVVVERLPEDVRTSLSTVAVVGSEFTADELSVLAELEGDRALEHLDIAISAGVVSQTGTRYEFRHDLVRDRLVELVSAEVRTAAHRRAAECLAQLGAPPARVAHHLLVAGRDDEAVPWLRKAASDALAVGAHADALATAERGLDVAPRDPALLASRADALNCLGDPRAPAAYALAMAVSTGPARSAMGIRRAKALISAGDVGAARDTLAALDTVPGDELAQLHIARGLASWCTGALDEADAAGRAARRLAEQAGDVRDFVDATMLLAMVAHERGAWPQRVVLDMLDEHIRPDLAAVVTDAHLCVSEAYLYGGVPYSDVVDFASDLQRQAASTGSGRAEAFATTLLGEALLLTGKPVEAARLLSTAAAQHRHVGVVCGEAISLQRLAEARLVEGDDAGAGAALAAALLAARASPAGARHLLDRVHGTAVRCAPNTGEALAAVDERACGVRGPLETCPPCSINFTVPAAIACARAHELERAQRYLAASEQIVAAFYPRGGWHPALDEVRAHIALAREDVPTATRLLASAVAAFDALGQRLDGARCRKSLDELAVAGKV